MAMNSDLISKASDTSSVSKIFPCGWRHSKLPKKRSFVCKLVAVSLCGRFISASLFTVEKTLSSIPLSYHVSSLNANEDKEHLLTFTPLQINKLRNILVDSQ